MSYKIQLHPKSAVLTVRSREDIAKIVALYDRLRKARTTAYPFFIFPITYESPKKPNGIIPFTPITFSDPNGIDSKGCYRANLTHALENLYKIEAGYGRNTKEALPPFVPEYERYEKEAEDILNLIAEYRSLPEELGYAPEWEKEKYTAGKDVK